MNGLTIEPGSERSFVFEFDNNGNLNEEPQPIRPSQEVGEHELEQARRELLPVIERGQRAQERLDAEAARQLRELREGREFADVDPDATPEENALYDLFRRTYRSGGR